MVLDIAGGRFVVDSPAFLLIHHYDERRDTLYVQLLPVPESLSVRFVLSDQHAPILWLAGVCVFAHLVNSHLITPLTSFPVRCYIPIVHPFPGVAHRSEG